MRLTYKLLTCLPLVLLAGCSTYVNIPKQPGDVAENSPNTPTTSAVTAEALRATIENRPIGRTFEIVLFEDTHPDNARAIVPKVSRHAVWAADNDQGALPTLQVHRLRVRDNNAWVDITRPAHANHPHSGDQLVTVHLRWSISGGWQATRIEPWRVDPATALLDQPLTYDQAHPERATNPSARNDASTRTHRTHTPDHHPTKNRAPEDKPETGTDGAVAPTGPAPQGPSNSTAVTPLDP